MPQETVPVNRTRAVVGLLLVRVIVPAYVLVGAISKFAAATPFKLPRWMQDSAMAWAEAAFAGSGGPAFVRDFITADHLLPVDAAEALLLNLLKLILLIEFLGAGLMIFVPRLARSAAIVILSAFCFVLIAEITHHARIPSVTLWDAAFSGDCGCFGGAMSVPPGVMLITDVLLLLGAVLLPTGRTLLADTPKWAIAGLLVWIAVAVSLALDPRVPPEEDQTPWHALQPNAWIGHSIDETVVARGLNIDHALFNGGRQTWILYRDTCPSCHTLFAEKYSAEEMDRVIVAISVPVPAEDRARGEDLGPIVCPTCQWYVLPEGQGFEELPTPIEIMIDENGIIERVRNAMLEAASDDEKDL